MSRVNGMMGCVSILGLVLALAACGPQEEPLPEGWNNPAPAPTPSDPEQMDPAAPATPPSALQSVISEITLPQTGTEHGLDLDGDGIVDNQVGRLLGQLKDLIGLVVQPAVNEELKAGKAIVLYDVLANSLVNDGQVELRAYVGKDLDGDPSDNFSGAETFMVKRGIVDNAVFPASIVSNKLQSTQARRGFVSIPFRTATAVLPLVATRIEATVGVGGMQHGILAGAIPVAEAIDRLAPVLTAELDRLYKKPDVAPMTYKALRMLLDDNLDGTITEHEFKTANAFGFLLHTADIDSNGDGTPDSISFGISFQSVPCTFTQSPGTPQ